LTSSQEVPFALRYQRVNETFYEAINLDSPPEKPENRSRARVAELADALDLGN